MKSSSRFILVCLFVLVVLASFLLSPDSVLAAVVRQATMTATNTTVPTPTSQFGVVCPVGTPIGWGTFTPSALWNLTCSSCLTPTAYPTNTAEPSVTPTYNGTGTPNPTITVTPTLVAVGTLQCNQVTAGIVCTEIDDYTIEFTGAVDYPPYTGGVGFQYFVTGSGFMNYVRFEVGDNDIVSRHFPTTSEFVITLRERGIAHMNSIGYFPSNHHIETDTGVEEVPAGVYDFSFITSGGAQEIYYDVTTDTVNQYFWNALVVGGSGSGKLTVSSYPIGGTPTPSPTATPYVDETFCGSINDLPSFGWDLIIEDGPPNCDFGWDEFTVGSYTVPAVQICLQPVQVGVITLFGVVYEMGVFFLAAGAAFFWRFFRTV